MDNDCFMILPGKWRIKADLVDISRFFAHRERTEGIFFVLCPCVLLFNTGPLAGSLETLIVTNCGSHSFVYWPIQVCSFVWKTIRGFMPLLCLIIVESFECPHRLMTTMTFKWGSVRFASIQSSWSGWTATTKRRRKRWRLCSRKYCNISFCSYVQPHYLKMFRPVSVTPARPLLIP